MYSTNLVVMAYGALHSDHTFKLGLMAQRCLLIPKRPNRFTVWPLFFWNKVYKTEVLLFNIMERICQVLLYLVKCGWTCVCKPVFKAILKGVGSF